LAGQQEGHPSVKKILPQYFQSFSFSVLWGTQLTWSNLQKTDGLSKKYLEVVLSN